MNQQLLYKLSWLRMKIRKPILTVARRMMRLSGLFNLSPIAFILPDGYLRHNVLRGKHTYCRWNGLTLRWDDVTHHYHYAKEMRDL